MSPMVKKVLGAVALKQVYDRVQEARQPQKPSFLARLFKLGLVGGVLGGAAYAYKNGMLPFGNTDKPNYAYDNSVSVHRPIETPANGEPVGAPHA